MFNSFICVCSYLLHTDKQIHPRMGKENTVNDGHTYSGYLCLSGT